MTISHQIPTIDISPYLNPEATPEDKAQVIEKVRSACSEYGFLQIVGHGIPVATQQAVLDSCKTFFDLPQSDKDVLSLKNNPARRGYERIGEQTLNAEARPDFKEGFYIGREVPAQASAFLTGPNQWPSLPAPTFHTPITAYYTHMLRLGTTLLTLLTLGLNHPPSVLSTLTHNPVVNLKLLHYPPHPTSPIVDARQFGAAAHTDFGTLTILLQQPGKHGLQVFLESSGEWINVPAREDVLVVNVGDLLGKWSGGVYRSTVHRVRNEGGGDRYSVPCFWHGSLGARNPFVRKEGEGRGGTVEEHIRGKFDASFGLDGKDGEVK